MKKRQEILTIRDSVREMIDRLRVEMLHREEALFGTLRRAEEDGCTKAVLSALEAVAAIKDELDCMEFRLRDFNEKYRAGDFQETLAAAYWLGKCSIHGDGSAFLSARGVEAEFTAPARLDNSQKEMLSKFGGMNGDTIRVGILWEFCQFSEKEILRELGFGRTKFYRLLGDFHRSFKMPMTTRRLGASATSGRKRKS